MAAGPRNIEAINNIVGRIGDGSSDGLDTATVLFYPLLQTIHVLKLLP